LYLRNSLGGSTRIDQTINQLGFSENLVVVIDQSDACLQIFAQLHRVSFKNAKTYPMIYPRGNLAIEHALVLG